LACLDAGCDEFLTKPLDREVLLDTANRLLRRHTTARM
jgi:DNA-binding response OmpR family regulator